MQPGWDDSTESHTLGGAVSSYFVMLDALGSRNDCGILYVLGRFFISILRCPRPDTLALLTRRIFTQLAKIFSNLPACSWVISRCSSRASCKSSDVEASTRMGIAWMI